MKQFKFLVATIATGAVLTLSSCKKDNFQADNPEQSDLKTMMKESGQNPDELALSSNQMNAARHHSDPYVYTESNDLDSNRILVYEEHPDGTLTTDGMATSGGQGNGMGLGSQGSVILTDDHKWLFAVNAGSNSISSFKVDNDGALTLKHTVSSYGNTPVSVCINNNKLYVVNSGSSDIQGYRVNANGTMTPINGSHQMLSAANAGPAQISFGPNGNWVVVTEKMTNKISRFNLNGAGASGAAVVTASTGQTPFGFSFAQNKYMIVSNAAGGAPNAGSCTSYGSRNGSFNPINGSVANAQSAPCWVSTTAFGRYAFVTNTGSNNISSYYINPSGQLYLVSANPTASGMAPIDIVVSRDNMYVYALCSADHTIYYYSRTQYGGISLIGHIEGLPAHAAGLTEY